jgi:hypothetical protein
LKRKPDGLIQTEETNLAESSKEDNGSKKAVLPIVAVAVTADVLTNFKKLQYVISWIFVGGSPVVSCVQTERQMSEI